MERRKGKVIIHTSGGTAGKGSNTFKLTLPSSWMKEMGISAMDREIDISFDGTAITINKRQSMEKFISAKRKQGHSLTKMLYFDGEKLCTTIIVDVTEKIIRIENHTDHILKTAFGNNMEPTWEDFQHFLEERCIPRTRAGLREYMESIGVDEYDPMEIIKRTEGKMAEDDQWIRMEVLA